MEETVETITNERATVFIRDTAKKNKYGPEQILKFIDLIQEEGISISMAAKQCLIYRSSEYVLFNQFNSSNGTVLPGGSSKKLNRGTPQKLFPEHTLFLMRYFDKTPFATLGLALEELTIQFDGLAVSPLALWKHLTNNFYFFL